jgi:hypothetical protein
VQASVNLFGGEREIYDFTRPRVGHGYFTTVDVVVRPTWSSSVELKGQRSLHYGTGWANLVDDAKIVRLKATYQLTRAIGLRLIGEYSDQYSSLISNPLSQQSTRFSSSALVSYEIAPGSFLYAGYDDTQSDFRFPIVPRDARLRTDNSIFLKLSYLFRIAE